MKIDFFAEVTITPRTDGVFFDRVEMLAQILHRWRIEDVRARFGPIESKHADSVVTDFAPDHGRRPCRSHRAHIGQFLPNSKRRERQPGVMELAGASE